MIVLTRFAIPRLWPATLYFAACLILPACHSAANTNTPKGIQMKNLIAQQPSKTVCVGRYLIDIPHFARITGGGQTYDWLSISVEENTTLAQFNEAITNRVAELKVPATRYDKPQFAGSFKFDNLKNAGMIYFWDDPDMPEHGYNAEVYYWFEGRLIFIKGYEHIYQTKNYTDDDDVKSYSSRVTKLLSSLRTMKEGEIPTEPGFCMSGELFLPSSGQPMENAGSEGASLSFDWPAHPDVYFRFATNTSRAQQPLLERAHEARKNLAMDGMDISKATTTLRSAAKRSVGGADGEELAERIRGKSGVESHSVDWESFGDPTGKSPNKAGLTLSMGTGAGKKNGEFVQSSLDDGEVLTLWDTVLETIRLRVAAPVKTSAIPAQQVQLGATIRTGQVCPQNGIWESKVGGNKVFMREGENVPHAAVKLPVSSWQKLKGTSQSEYVETTWVLNEYRDKSGKPLA